MTKMNKNSKNKGFTLVELLVSISLIAILSGVIFTVINPRGIQQKSRDSQRVSDLAKIKVALESYFSDNRGYPVSTDSDWESVSKLSDDLATDYINNIPADPEETGDICTDGAWRNYVYRSDGYVYVLATNMETISAANADEDCPASDGSLCEGCTFQSADGSSYGYFTSAD